MNTASTRRPTSPPHHANSIADRELSRNHSTIECEDNRSPSVSASSSSRGGGGGGSGGEARNEGSDDDSSEAVGLRRTMPRDSMVPIPASTALFDNDGGSGDAGGGGGGRGDEEDASQRGDGGGDEAGRLEYFLCDVGSTNGTYVQVGCT